jgi:hypothetical protein
MIPLNDLKMEFDEHGHAISGEVVFTHVDDKTGEVRHFAVERIAAWLSMQTRIPIIKVKLDPVFAHWAMTRRGIEMHRFTRISKRIVKANPIVFAHMPGIARDADGEHLIIDGNHRYCRAVYFGETHIRGYVLEPEHWEPFLVDVPAIFDEFQRDRIERQDVDPIDSRIR